MASVKLKYEDKVGLLSWQQESAEPYAKIKNITINFPDKKVTATLEKFLDTPRVFFIPQSDQLDDYEVLTRKPIESRGFFHMSLCELYCQTDIKPLWETWKD